MYRDAKYLIAYLIPLTMFLALWGTGVWSFSVLLFAFFIVPIVEFFLNGTTENLDDEGEQRQLGKRFFDWMLYLNLPLYFAFLTWYLWQVNNYFYSDAPSFSTFDLVGKTLCMGIYLGGMGINVAHELGHRVNRYEQWMAKALLLPNLYMHFAIEHNRGHHLNVSTDKDPASSRLNEPIYTFYFRSVIGSWFSAWHLEAERLQKEGSSVWSLKNEMLWFQVLQLMYLVGVAVFVGPIVALFAVIVGILGFLMLETVNYIEHYGLRRRMLPSGYYERVQPWHSWNSNHSFGRILLFELTRHSDHHYKATRKYQILRHFDKSPQLPLGYPGSMLLALVPPLWFRLMNPKVAEHQQRLAEIEA